MIKYLKEKKFRILFFILIIVLFTYCGLKTFVINDDLPYSFFYRSEVRITSIKQIIRNQISDYLTINGRFFVHCVVQFVLMFGKNLFSIVNAICIAVTIFFMSKIVILKSKELKIKNIYLLFILLGLFLLLGDYKYLIYWVAGSVNYIWIFTFVLIFCYYYLKKGLNKYKFLNCVLLFAFSMVHECSFVFMLFLVISDLIRSVVEKNETVNLKKVIIYIVYIIFCILGGLVVIKAPGTQVRMSTVQYWYDMTFFERLFKSIPVVSLNLFKLFNIDNLIPTIFIVLLVIYNFKYRSKICKIISSLIFFFSLIAYSLNNGWIYFILSILVFIDLIIINYLNKDNYMSVLNISFYAVVFSMIITPEYFAARPNYYIYIWMIINICIYINNISDKKAMITIIQIFSIILILFMCAREYKIYSYIGNIHSERLRQIEIVKQNNLKVLKYKIINSKYEKYHPDANCPGDTTYWAYRFFRYYYDLDEDVKIELVD